MMTTRAAAIPAEAEVYRDLLREILGEIESTASEHPKLREAHHRRARCRRSRGENAHLLLADRHARAASSRARRRLGVQHRGGGGGSIRKRRRRTLFDTREVDDRRQRGRHSLLQARFHRPQDALYLALREPYLRTLAPMAGLAHEQLARIVRDANKLLRRVRVGKTAAERLDYQVAKRCVEQAAAKLWSKGRRTRRDAPEALSRLRDPGFIQLGLDLEADEFENDSLGDEKLRWEISERVAQMILGRGGSLWEVLSTPLDPSRRSYVSGWSSSSRAT